MYLDRGHRVVAIALLGTFCVFQACYYLSCGLFYAGIAGLAIAAVGSVGLIVLHIKMNQQEKRIRQLREEIKGIDERLKEIGYFRRN
jgi:hypothetical protein